MNKVFIFVLGAAVGCVASWQYFKRKYEARADEEIESVIKSFSAKEKKEEKTKKEDSPEHKSSLYEKPSVMEYAEKIKSNGYTDYSKTKEEDKPVTDDDDEITKAPYIIEPDEQGIFADWSVANLTYFAGDNVLVNEEDQPIVDVEYYVGDDNLKLDNFVDDAVYIRNELLKTDYEVILDKGNFSDLT